MFLLLADEHFPVVAIAYLRAAGWDLVSIREAYKSLADDRIVDLASSQNRIILTFDSDFGELSFRDGIFPPAGIIYLRDDATDPSLAGQIVEEILSGVGFDTTGHLTVYNGRFFRQKKFLP